MVNGVLSYNKLVVRTRRLVKRAKVPVYWSKTCNEKFNVHTVCVLFVLFQIEQKDYRLFSGWLSITTALGLSSVPHFTTLQKAFARLPPKLIRKLMQLAGKCKDRIASLDPTYFQLTNPSKGYCKRIGRDPRRDKLRKATVVVGTNKKKVLDVFVKAKERHGMKDVPEIAKSKCFKGRTVLADKEFDAEKFHQIVEDSGGKKSIVPTKYPNIPIHRTKGKHRKELKRKGIPKTYTKRSASESNNSAIKRRFSPVLKGKNFWQQARNLYGKYLAYNLTIDSSYLIIRNFLQNHEIQKF